MWKKIVLQILDGVKDIPSPFDYSGKINCVFVILDMSSRIGFMWAWCSVTHRGINISRMQIPETMNYVTGDDFSKMNIPTINFENPI